ncbi:MAG: monovalent cation/H(+) antiporter subunit G [Bacteroidota bacterium]|nr:monovalent cation/H(+) antiporter subunit G [Bacteroidota bacterium]
MIEIIVGILVLLSAVTIFIASVGIVRFDNLFARMHVVTKVSSFASLILLVAVNLLFLNWKVAIISVLIFHVLIFLSPISTHVVAKVSETIKKLEEKSNDNLISTDSLPFLASLQFLARAAPMQDF